MPRIFGLRNCLQEVQDSIQLFGQSDEPLKHSVPHFKGQNSKHDPQESIWHVSHSELTLGSFETLDITNTPGKILSGILAKDQRFLKFGRFFGMK